MAAAPLLPLLAHHPGLAPPTRARPVPLHLAVAVFAAHVVLVAVVVVVVAAALVAAAVDCDGSVGPPEATANKIQLIPVAFFPPVLQCTLQWIYAQTMTKDGSASARNTQNNYRTWLSQWKVCFLPVLEDTM